MFYLATTFLIQLTFFRSFISFMKLGLDQFIVYTVYTLISNEVPMLICNTNSQFYRLNAWRRVRLLP
jgi:hypothetical protein